MVEQGAQPFTISATTFADGGVLIGTSLDWKLIWWKPRGWGAMRFLSPPRLQLFRENFFQRPIHPLHCLRRVTWLAVRKEFLLVQNYLE